MKLLVKWARKLYHYLGVANAVSMLIGVVIGTLFGLGAADLDKLWALFPKGTSVTDWIVAICTIGMLVGTSYAAMYAKKAAHYSIINKLDEVYATLGRDLEIIRSNLMNLKELCNILLDENQLQELNYDEVEKCFFYYLGNILDESKAKNIASNTLFMENFIKYPNYYSLSNNSVSIKLETEDKPLCCIDLKFLSQEADFYWENINNVLLAIKNKYREVNNMSKLEYIKPKK